MIDHRAGSGREPRVQDEKRGTRPRAHDQTKAEEPEQEPTIVVRDKRRIDPQTGAVRESVDRPAPGSPQPEAPAHEGAPEGVENLKRQLAERTEDVKRVQAEYANYRKRVDRDRLAVREQALAGVLMEFLPVLDDIGRAREHGELEGAFRQVGESLERVVSKLGLVRFGEKGEPFDPKVHEALMHSYSDEVTETTCVEILQPGYSIASRVLRPARVAVAEPTTALPQEEDGTGAAADATGADQPAEESAEGAAKGNDR